MHNLRVGEVVKSFSYFFHLFTFYKNSITSLHNAGRHNIDLTPNI